MNGCCLYWKAEEIWPMRHITGGEEGLLRLVRVSLNIPGQSQAKLGSKMKKKFVRTLKPIFSTFTYNSYSMFKECCAVLWFSLGFCIVFFLSFWSSCTHYSMTWQFESTSPIVLLNYSCTTNQFQWRFTDRRLQASLGSAISILKLTSSKIGKSQCWQNISTYIF